jgi:hypothetical protein
MSIETVNDLVTQIANWIGVYGTHEEIDLPTIGKECACRCCFESIMANRIRLAVKIETILARAEGSETSDEAAAALEHLTTTNQALMALVNEASELNTFDTEYAGYVLTFCAYCKVEQEGRGEQHEGDCFTVKARALIRTQPLHAEEVKP